MNLEKSPTPWRRRAALVLLTTFVTSFLLGVGTQAAIALTYSSQTGYFTVAPYDYRNWATIITSSGSARATTSTGPQSPVGGGYVGSRGRLMIDGGTTLSCEGTNVYNSTTISYPVMVVGSSCTRTTSGAWYSWGVSRAWNGSGYNSIYTYKSRSQNS